MCVYMSVYHVCAMCLLSPERAWGLVEMKLEVVIRFLKRLLGTKL